MVTIQGPVELHGNDSGLGCEAKSGRTYTPHIDMAHLGTPDCDLILHASLVYLHTHTRTLTHAYANTYACIYQHT